MDYYSPPASFDYETLAATASLEKDHQGDRLWFVRHGGNVYAVMGASPNSAWMDVREAFPSPEYLHARKIVEIDQRRCGIPGWDYSGDYINSFYLGIPRAWVPGRGGF